MTGLPSSLALAAALAGCTLALGGGAHAAGEGAPGGSAPATSAAPGSPTGKTPAAEDRATGVARGRKLAQRIQRFYGRCKDFEAAFAQSYTYAALGRTEEKRGVVQVKRPGLLRWEYTAPEKKLLILDGKAFWQWLPEDNQVIVKRDVSQEQLSSAFTFLWGKGELLAEFAPRAIALPDGLPPGDALELMPKKEGGTVQKLLFSIDAQGRVLASVVTDGQGNTNRLVFSGAKIDQKLPDALFQFAPPAGAGLQEIP